MPKIAGSNPTYDEADGVGFDFAPHERAKLIETVLMGLAAVIALFAVVILI